MDSLSLSLSIYIYIYIYVCVCVQGLAGVGVFVLSSQDKLEEKKRDGDEEGADDKVLL
jgi:hypothetical protein